MIHFAPETHTYTDDAGRIIPSVTQVIRDAGMCGSWQPNAWYMTRGTFIHEATELLDRDILDWDTLDPRIAGYVRAWKQFRLDTHAEYPFVEQIVSYQVAGHVQYAGTVDRAGVGGLDIKSGVPAPWHVAQVAAYAKATTGLGQPWGCVYLRDDGIYRLRTYSVVELYEGWCVFCAALEIWNWKWRNNVK